MTADIEFGFAQGRLALFQIRPFVESRRAWHSRTLQEMDRQIPYDEQARVDLDALPLARQAEL